MALITVTGGAGNLGREVTRLLVERGESVRVVDLPEVDVSFLEAWPQVEFVGGDLRDRPSVAQACAGADYVIHLAAIMPPLSETNQALARAVNIEGTRNLLAEMPARAGLIFASSVATYGLAGDDIVMLDRPQSPIDFYGETKLQSERDIRASGRPATIARISGISVPALLEIPRPWFFSRDQHVEFIHLADAALAIANAVGNVQAENCTLLVAGGSTWRTTGKGYSNAVCEAFDVDPASAAFLDQPNWPAWYDTTDSQRRLDYQKHTFADWIGELKAIYKEAIGE